MSKVADNKQQKLEALYTSAFKLFLTKGFTKTSISDIVDNANVAKGTFYLYFKDKEDIRDRLIAKTSASLFLEAIDQLSHKNISNIEDRIIFIVDYALNYMQTHKDILRFISKNLSWGIFKHALTTNIDEPNSSLQIYHRLLNENKDVHLNAPDIMLFMIIELTSSACYSTILDNDPIPFEQLKPYLYQTIKAIIQNHLQA
ncbi:MAG: TetR/AcrR family transcriptional regulator [Erysipelotrichaceae bacterium]|nr:TetR/AcrR family transcriptional regulator [Erysipelotrichaceae bacterium]MDY5252410.1 TetR/AcrR family transcriptional regulator [Erysipelotrichaceae bacterium]